MALLKPCRIYVLCTVILGLVFAERPPVEELGATSDELSNDYESSEGAAFPASHRLAEISRADEGEEDDDANQVASTESLEVRQSPHAVGFKRSQGSDEANWEQRERSLRHQLELTREERGEAEALQASEQQEASALARKLEMVSEEQEHTRDMLKQAQRELAAKQHEVDSVHQEADRYLNLADDLREAATEASESASRAEQEASIAKQKIVDERVRARQGLMAAKQTYEEETEKARKVQALAAEQRRKSLAAQQQMGQEAYVAVQMERLKAEKALSSVKKAEEERQKHYKAAATMRAETSEAEALVKEASSEKAAIQEERSKLMWEKQQAYRDRHNASMLSLISWGVLASFSFIAIGLVMDVHKLETVAKVFGKFGSAAPVAEAVPLPSLPDSLAKASLVPEDPRAPLPDRLPKTAFQAVPIEEGVEGLEELSLSESDAEELSDEAF